MEAVPDQKMERMNDRRLARLLASVCRLDVGQFGKWNLFRPGGLPNLIAAIALQTRPP